MVLLNGVKYACERCIRGHRVSSCTHTDKPLTMIKPKGRPASQCPHCREQRKLKNTHSSCNCGKKGKSPGQHLASCLCHKNSHCTCPSKDKKPRPKKSLVSGPNDETDAERAAAGLGFLIEDVVMPFETEQGLLDFFGTKPEHLADKGLASMDHSYVHHQSDPSFPEPPSDAELDLMENMFPLFPLVGNCLFDNSKSLPLLPLPDDRLAGGLLGSTIQLSGSTSQINGSYSANGSLTKLGHNGLSGQNGQLNGTANQFTSNLNGHATGSNQAHSSQANSSQLGLSAGNYQSTPLHSSTSQLSSHAHASSASLASQAPYQPRPLKASASFNSYAHGARPRRPESLLSITSTSSNTSKQNLLELTHPGISKLASTTAFPPYQAMENNSSDDFNGYYDSSGATDGHLFSVLNDYDELSRNMHMGTTTPQLSLPSRQPLQSRRKTSLSMTQFIHSHNHGHLAKEHAVAPHVTSSDTEGSPRHFSPSSEQGAFKNDTGLRQVEEDVKNEEDDLEHKVKPRDETLATLLANNPGLSLAEFLEATSIPMFLEFVNPVKHA